MPTATEQPLLRFRDLHKSFGGQTVLDGINGEIRPGEVILLRGENGSGKTTLLNILSGCLEPDRGSIEIAKPDGAHRESFTFPRSWYRGINPFDHFTPERVTRLGISRTWQDIRLIASLDLADNIAVATSESCDSPWNALFQPSRTQKTEENHRRSAHNRLASLGLAARASSSAAQISLGQSKRVAIIRALQTKARVLLLDEPLSGLDAAGMHEILAQLRDLATQHRIVLVIVEHVLNIPRLLDFVTSVWTLQGGTLRVEVPQAVQLEITQHRLGQSIHDVVRLRLGSNVPTTQISLGNDARLTTYWLRGVSDTVDPVLTVESLIMKRGRRTIFGSEGDEAASGGLSFQLHRHTVNVLEAPNGWGKSSLAQALASVVPVARGTVYMRGLQLAKTPWQRRRQGLAVCMCSDTIFPSLTVGEHRRLANVSNSQVMESSEAFSAKRYASMLSGGEQHRLSLSLLPGQGEITLIMDEPFVQLDHNHLSKVDLLGNGEATLILNPGSHLTT